ncbi:MAG: MlaD family protein [bacterium]|jgi:phospholipid/cholesterol/gamma-HCH transport system substrate-binding protein|nr:MCE family protein [Planctomycetota bacterium]HIL51371.1 MCE family protein [Planctomycetota bacterium]
MNTTNHFLLGLLFVGALSILGYFTFFLSDFSFLGNVQQITVHFPEAGGLREGDSVLVAGVRWGKVTTITYDPSAALQNKRITVLLSLDKDAVALHEDHTIRIEDATLLGGKNLSIDPGTASEALVPADQVLFGTLQLNVVEAAGEWIDKNGDALSETVTFVRDLVEGVSEGRGTVGLFLKDEQLADRVESLVYDAADTAANLKTITARLERGEGSLGQLLVKDDLLATFSEITDSLQQLLDEGNAVMADAREGKGLLGAILVDEQLSENVTLAMSRLRAILVDLAAGKGTIGRLLSKEEIGKDLQTIMDRLAKGEGSLGKFMKEDEFYENARQISVDLKDIIAQVRDGRGSVGRLIMEEDLYNSLLRAVGLLTRSLEEYREAAPISTMTSVIFGAF